MTGTAAYNYTVDSDGQRLSNSGYHRVGKPNWWLMRKPGPGESSGTFVNIPRVRGDDSFCQTLLLEPGRYVLGVGKKGVGKAHDSIRINVNVKVEADTEETP